MLSVNDLIKEIYGRREIYGRVMQWNVHDIG